jgi:hypothetical protein
VSNCHKGLSQRTLTQGFPATSTVIVTNDCHKTAVIIIQLHRDSYMTFVLDLANLRNEGLFLGGQSGTYETTSSVHGCGFSADTAYPGNVSRQLNLAWVYAQTGRKAEAAALYEEILRRDRDRVATLSASDGKSIEQLAKRGLTQLKNN